MTNKLEKLNDHCVNVCWRARNPWMNEMCKQVDAEYSFQPTNEKSGTGNPQGNVYSNIELRFDVE